MARLALYFSVLVCLCHVYSLNLPGPLVYVVTPSSRPRDQGRSAPFYYHNWMRRMDSPTNATSTTTTKSPKVETPDLIFAEFESDSEDSNKKSLRNLLEKEKIHSKTITTTKPIYVPDKAPEVLSVKHNYGLPVNAKAEDNKKSTPDMTDYFALYNNFYNNDAAPAVPSTTPSIISKTTASTTTTSATDAPELDNVQNIWHVIDSEKENQYGTWEEAPIDPDSELKSQENKQPDYSQKVKQDTDEVMIDDNFALPGFGTNPGNDAENESRAIRTEPNVRFPYVNLKPFQMKSPKKPVQNIYTNGKKGNDLFTNLDNFRETKNPVRGEAQDVTPMRQPIDRYNPAQPYLPPTKYGIKQKDSNQDFPAPVKSVASLVPPPPPPSAGNDFPAPSSYESFPPYASFNMNPSPAPAPASAPAPGPAPPPPPPPPKPQSASNYQPHMNPSDDSGPSYDTPPDDDGNDDSPSIDLGYRYKPPSPPAQPFVPTLPPLSKPFKGYSYDKPTMTMDAPPVADKPDFGGYHYNKPEPAAPPSEDHPPSASYDHHGPPSYHDSDYPELIFNKQHGGMGDAKGGDDMKANDMGMMAPPPPDMKPDMDQSGPPPDDQGFPHDFPGDFKYHHDFDDHDFYHHHHHHTTTTTTTEMPRVNRYSYYYLGKKLYYLPLYFSVYFIVYVGALIIKAVLRHKIVYPNSWRPNDMTQNFFSKRSVDSWDLSNDNLHEVTGRVTAAFGKAAEKYMNKDAKED